MTWRTGARSFPLIAAKVSRTARLSSRWVLSGAISCLRGDGPPVAPGDLALEIPVDCPLLIIEGDGARRREVAHLIDTLIWVQADEREAGRRAAARVADPPAADLASKAFDGAPFDEGGWMAEERPFNTAQRTWERADIIVCGTLETPTTRALRSSSHRLRLHPLIRALAQDPGPRELNRLGSSATQAHAGR